MKSRLVGLDILRAFAVLLVMGRHMWNPPVRWPSTVRTPLALWRNGGWVGVDLFFVLSGFLVAGLLLRELQAHGRISPLRFYARRAWKIYPPFFVMLAVTSLAILVTGGSIERSQLLAEVLFVQSYAKGLWEHTWSLAVEEHFYLLLPIVFLLVLRASRGPSIPVKRLLLVGLAVAVGELALRIGTALGPAGYSHRTHHFATHLRLDALFFGVVLSVVYHSSTDRFVELLKPWRMLLLTVGGLLLAPAFLLKLETNPLLYTAGFTVLYVGSGMLVVGALLCDVRHNRVLDALAALGASSYSVYLWHMPVRSLIDRLELHVGVTLHYGVRAAIYVAGSIAVGMVMARLVEVPALRLRDLRMPSRSTAAPRARARGALETPAGTAAIG